MALKTSQLRLSSLRNRKKNNVKKWMESKRPVWHHPEYHHTQKRSLRRRGQWERGRNKIWRNMAKNFPNSMKNINLLIQEAQWTQSSINSNRSTHRHGIIKLFKRWEKNLENIRRDVIYHIQGNLNKIKKSFFIRSHVIHKAVGWHSQRIKQTNQPLYEEFYI